MKMASRTLRENSRCATSKVAPCQETAGSGRAITNIATKPTAASATLAIGPASDISAARLGFFAAHSASTGALAPPKQ